MSGRTADDEAREAEALRELSDEGMALPSDEIPAGARNGPDLAPPFEPSTDPAVRDGDRPSAAVT